MHYSDLEKSIYASDVSDDDSLSGTAQCAATAWPFGPLPSFFVVGPPRTGTTWLREALRKHANLPYPSKETRFFDLHFQRGLKWYCAHFGKSNCGNPVGEIAPTYFASPQARKRIAATLPNAKLIFVFRNPVQRIVSLYKVKRAYGMIPWSLEDALQRDPELIVSGRYATILKDWQREFPAKQLLVTIYDDLQSDPQAFVDRVTGFIGIPPVLLSARLRKLHGSDGMTLPRSYLATRTALLVADWCKARRWDHVVAYAKKTTLIKFFLGHGEPFPDVPPDLLQKISALFRPEVERLEAIIDRDLSNWKTPSLSPSVET